MNQAKDTAARTVSKVFIAVMLSAYLLCVPEDGYLSIGDFKYTVFLALTCAYSAAMLVICVSSKVKAKSALSCGYITDPAVIAAAVYVLFTSISAITSEYGVAAFSGGTRHDGFATAALYALMFLLLYRYARAEKWMIYLFGASMTVFCVICLWQFAGGNPLGLFPEDCSYYDANVRFAGEYVGTAGNAELSAAVLCMAVPAFIAGVSRLKDKAGRLLLIPLMLSVYVLRTLGQDAGSIALAAAPVLVLPAAVRDKRSLAGYMLSCGCVCAAMSVWASVRWFVSGAEIVITVRSWIYLAVGAILFAFAAVTSKRGDGSISRKRVCTLSLVLLVLLLASVLIYISNYSGEEYGTVYEASEIIHGRWDDSYGGGRIYIWRSTLELFRERPLFGGGPDTLALRGITPYKWYSEASGAVRQSAVTAAHCEYLNVLVNQGVLALAAYLSFLGVQIYRWYLGKESTGADICGGAAACYCVQAMFGISMCASTAFLWMALALVKKDDDMEKTL